MSRPEKLRAQQEWEQQMADRIHHDMPDDDDGGLPRWLSPMLIGAALWVLVGFIYYVIWST